MNITAKSMMSDSSSLREEYKEMFKTMIEIEYPKLMLEKPSYTALGLYPLTIYCGINLIHELGKVVVKSPNDVLKVFDISELHYWLYYYLAVGLIFHHYLENMDKIEVYDEDLDEPTKLTLINLELDYEPLRLRGVGRLIFDKLKDAGIIADYTLKDRDRDEFRGRYVLLINKKYAMINDVIEIIVRRLINIEFKALRKEIDGVTRFLPSLNEERFSTIRSVYNLLEESQIFTNEFDNYYEIFFPDSYSGERISMAKSTYLRIGQRHYGPVNVGLRLDYLKGETDLEYLRKKLMESRSAGIESYLMRELDIGKRYRGVIGFKRIADIYSRPIGTLIVLLVYYDIPVIAEGKGAMLRQCTKNIGNIYDILDKRGYETYMYPSGGKK